jgi:hypothetical protein
MVGLWGRLGSLPWILQWIFVICDRGKARCVPGWGRRGCWLPTRNEGKRMRWRLGNRDADELWELSSRVSLSELPFFHSPRPSTEIANRLRLGKRRLCPRLN